MRTTSGTGQGMAFVLDDAALVCRVPDLLFSQQHVRACVARLLADPTVAGEERLGWVHMEWLSRGAARYLEAAMAQEQRGCLIWGSLYDADALWQRRNRVPAMLAMGLLPEEMDDHVRARGFSLFAGPASAEPRAVTHLVFLLGVWTELARRGRYDFSQDPDGLETFSELTEHARRIFRTQCTAGHTVGMLLESARTAV